MSALPPKFSISTVLSKHDNDPKLSVVTWQEFTAMFASPRKARCTRETCATGEFVEYDKDGKPKPGCRQKDGRSWLPATFSGTRTNENTRALCMLVVDFDHVTDDDTLETLLSKLAKYQYLAHPSHSDKPGNRCVRVAIPLSSPVPGKAWSIFWPTAMKFLDMPVPADPACRNSSRLYYLPSRPSDADYWCIVHEGVPLDVAELEKLVPAQAPSVADVLTPDAAGKFGPGQRHAYLISVAGALRNRGDSEDMIFEHLKLSNRNCDPSKPEGELRDIAKWAAAQKIGEAWKTEGAPKEAVNADDPFQAELAQALADVKAKLETSSTGKRSPLFNTDAVDLLQEDIPDAAWQVTGLITKGGIAAGAGEPKAGIKTWLLIEGSVATATGTKMCGEFFAEAGRVAIFFAEDQKRAVRNRVRAVLKGAGRRLPAGRLFLQPRGEFIDVLKDEDLAWIVASCRRLGQLDLLVLDPLRDVHSGEENESDSMRDVMRRLRVLAELLGCTVWVSHHTPKVTKDTAKRRAGQNLRGSSAIHGSIDSGLYIEPLEGDGTNTFKARITSQVKAGRSSGTFDVQLDIIDDDKGQALEARWTFSRPGGKAKPSKHQSDDDAVYEFVRSLAMRGEVLTRTDLKRHEERPVAEKKVTAALDRLIECKRLALSCTRVVVPGSQECNAND